MAELKIYLVTVRVEKPNLPGQPQSILLEFSFSLEVMQFLIEKPIVISTLQDFKSSKMLSKPEGRIE